jgi:hypothetical protein
MLPMQGVPRNNYTEVSLATTAQLAHRFARRGGEAHGIEQTVPG